MTDREIVERLAREVMGDAVADDGIIVPLLRYSNTRKVFDPLNDANDTWRCVDEMEKRGWRALDLWHAPNDTSWHPGCWQFKLALHSKFGNVVHAIDLNRNRAICLAMLAALDVEKEKA